MFPLLTLDSLLPQPDKPGVLPDVELVVEHITNIVNQVILSPHLGHVLHNHKQHKSVHSVVPLHGEWGPTAMPIASAISSRSFFLSFSSAPVQVLSFEFEGGGDDMSGDDSCLTEWFRLIID